MSKDTPDTFDLWLTKRDAEVCARVKWEFLDEQLGNVRMQVEAERAGTIREVPND